MINTATDPMTIEELTGKMCDCSMNVEPTEVAQEEQQQRVPSPPSAEELLFDRPREFTRMELELDAWTSIYIPVLSDKLVLQNHNDMIHKFQPKFLRDFLEKVLRIGKVRRIDYVDRDIPNSSTPVKGAFVHFEYWYDTQTARNLREKLNTYGQFRQKGYMYKGKRCNFFQHSGDITDPARPGYFDIRINHKPIEETECDWNIHQLYAENQRLEKEMSTVQDTNQQMQSQLEYQHNMLINMQTELDYYRSMYSNDTPQPNIVVPNPPQPEITYEQPVLMRTDTLQKPTLTRSQTAHYV
tara:strand:- start:7330 stop:8223 length:894 start_codon:yes stop_codon:yes gene_type:complete